MTIKELQERLDTGWGIDCGEAKEMAGSVTAFLLELGYKHGRYASRDIINGAASRWRYAYITNNGSIEYYNESADIYNEDKIISADVVEAVATEYFDAITPSSEDIDRLLQEVTV